MTSPPAPVKRRALAWADVPEFERKRLAGRERAQRAETKRRGLPVEVVDVEHLWGLQRSKCGCDARCGPLNPFAEHGDPDAIVIGHQYARSLRGGHTINNVRLQRADCNQLAASTEKTAKAKRDRFVPNFAKRESTEQPKSKSKFPKRHDPWGKKWKAKQKAAQ
ncbi:MAG: hypothetical protein AAF583_01460 [Pseudomonadota bacterium]